MRIIFDPKMKQTFDIISFLIKKKKSFIHLIVSTS